MAYNNEYPYFDSGQFNVDWMLNKIKKIEEDLSGTKTYDYKGENEVLDLNDLRPNSMASFTENFNVLNAPVSGVRRFVFTNGSTTGGLQRCYDLKTMEVYARSFTITNSAVIWASWVKTQLKPGTVLTTGKYIFTGDFNTLENNKVLFLYTNNMQNAPRNGYGYLITWKPDNDGAKIQIFFSTENFFIYIRSFSGSIWSPWHEANHIDLTPYFKYSSISDNADLNVLSSILNKNGYVRNALNRPVSTNGYVFTYGNSGIAIQFYYPATAEHGYWRIYTGAWSSWHTDFNLHRTETGDGNALVASNFTSGLFTSDSPESYLAIIGIGVSVQSDQYQIAFSSTNNLFTRFRNGPSSWTSWIKYQRASTREVLLASSLPINTSTDDNGKERTMIEENLYTETANSSNSEYLNCPGQSLYHSDPDAQSYSEAIRAREDLTSFDTIITNLEQWDMDIPLTELVERTREFVQGIKDIHPLADIVILSVPPVDVPFLGEELYNYAWPSGNTLTEVDDALAALAQEVGFSYITWKEYKHIQNTNLLTFYDNLYEEPVYKRSLESYVSRQVKNCIE